MRPSFLCMCSLAACLVCGLGCSEPEPAAPSSAQTETPEPTPLAEEPEPAEPADAPPSLAEGPPTLPDPPPLPEAEVVRVTGEGGVQLVGDLRAAPDAPGAPLVVLVHQLSSQRTEWTPLLRHLAAEPALSTFAFDMRGHGESTEGRGGRELAWQAFETGDWARVEADLRAVVDALIERLEPSRVLLVGSSIGSSAVLREAASDARVHAVAALSPGRAYRGLDALTPLTEFGERPLLALASRQEQAAAETARDMARIAPQGRDILVDGDAHGVGMFERDASSLAHLVAFLRTQARAGGEEEPNDVP